MPPDRALKACLQCRKKKRKCNGRHPCRNCSNTNRECTYSEPAPKRSPSNENLLTEKAEIETDSTPVKKGEKRAALNSGDLLAKRLGLSTDCLSGESRLCSWNFRLHKARLHKAPSYLSITRPFSEILTTQHMHRLADIYFAEIQPVYTFLDPETAHRAISVSSDQPPEHPSNCVLLGIAALACLFSREESSDLESEIVHSARASLEYSTTLSVPTIDHVVGWLLRVLYLRFTSSPNPTWLASCTLMHLIETVKLHVEPAPKSNSNSVQVHGLQETYSPQLRRRIYYTAQIFNTWISYDYGQARIIPRDASCTFPSEGWTTESRIFWKLSDSLDPNLQLNATDLESMLEQTVQLKPSHPAMKLKRCNIALCIYRRLRVTGCAVSTKAVDKVLQLGDDGLQIATTMAKAHSPWWHVLNVPFQLLCVLLAIDTRASLSRVEQVFQTLKLLADEYGPQALRETWASACTLLRLQIRRKRDDFELLNIIENDILAWNSGEAPLTSLDQSLPDPSQLLPDAGSYGLGEFWELDEIFSTNLFNTL